MATVRSQGLSLAVHICIGLLLFIAAGSVRGPLPTPPPAHVTPLTLLRMPRRIDARAGASNQTALPARRGSPPPQARRTFIPPASTDHPAIALPITISFDIPLDVASADIGDPLSKFVDGGLGSHGINGIGDRGCCGGIGNSPSGTPGLSAVHRERGIIPPELVYKVEPEFSEDARKAKYQGVVVLSIEVDSNGNVRNIHVRQSLGLGLDEQAIEAVSRWRFRPGILNGKPVTTDAVVEVNFQLL